MIKRLFSVVITVSLAVASLGAMERPRAAQEKARERAQQRSQQRPAGARRPAQGQGQRRPANQGQRRPGNGRRPGNPGQRRPNPWGLNCQPPQHQRPQHDAYDSEDDSSDYSSDSLDRDSFEDDNFLAQFNNMHVARQPINPAPQLGAGNPAPQINVRPATNRPAANAAVRGNCSICLEALADMRQLARVVACNHHFHPACIQEWMNSRQHQAHNCPICRVPIQLEQVNN